MDRPTSSDAVLDQAMYRSHADEDLKLCRMSISGRSGERSIIDFHWLAARPGAAEVEHFVDRHELWLCPAERLVGAFERAGFRCRIEPDGLMPGRGLIVGRRAAWWT